MKGILLCGGEGTRLRPFTEVVNKHLIRVGRYPMAEYPLRSMIAAGIREFMIVVGGDNFAGVVKYFGSGRKWNIRISYAIQDEPGGIAQALGLCESFAGGDKILVCLGDNVWTMPLTDQLADFDKGAMFFATHSDNWNRFGVLKFKDSRVRSNGTELFDMEDVIEKPSKFVSSYVLAGIYAFGWEVFEFIHELKPSARGELEIADINRRYIQAGAARVMMMTGKWSDCGTIDSLLQAEEFLNAN